MCESRPASLIVYLTGGGAQRSRKMFNPHLARGVLCISEFIRFVLPLSACRRTGFCMLAWIVVLFVYLVVWPVTRFTAFVRWVFVVKLLCGPLERLLVCKVVRSYHMLFAARSRVPILCLTVMPADPASTVCESGVYGPEQCFVYAVFCCL